MLQAAAGGGSIDGAGLRGAADGSPSTGIVSTIPVCSDPTLEAFLQRVRTACEENRAQLTLSAQQDAADIGFDRSMVENLLMRLSPGDFEKRVRSDRGPGEWVWIFLPALGDLHLRVRLLERRGIVVISFHEV